jgi:3-methyladenine DNA glycosylase/8-oxoguanine DNA glycosylase
VAEGTAALRAAHPSMDAAIAALGPCAFTRRRGDNYAALVRSILYQQLAGKAAAAIHGRVLALFDGPPTAEAMLALGEAPLRAAGVSTAKAVSLLDLSRRVAAGDLPLRAIGRLGDDDVIARLVTVRGIGTWTAHMFLIFQLGRFDVWPTGDYGVRKGYARIFGHDDMPTPRELDALGEIFRPYRTLAALYCWRAVDGFDAPPGW